MATVESGEAAARIHARNRRNARRAASTYEVHPPQSWTRRQRLEKDIYKWLQHYGGGSSFAYDFTKNQREIIAAILDALATGTAQAIAATRGDGKTTITEWVVMYLILTGKARLILYMAATDDLSKKFIHNIQVRFLKNERLAADYPEVCGPVADVGGNGSRAKHYMAFGAIPKKNGGTFEAIPCPFEWSTQELTFPEIPGSRAGGAKVVSGSLSGATRGFKDVDQRPDVLCIDDPDRDTRLTEETAAELERIIDSGLGFLGGQQKGLGRVMLTTVQGHFTVSAKFTDPKRKPAWHGRRFKFLEHQPTDMLAWTKYIELRELDWLNKTTLAHDYYVANFEAMNLGAVLGNPHRFFKDQGELSALQHYFNQVAEKGWEAVRREYDNEPPIDELPDDNGLTAHHVQRRLSGVPKLVVPTNAKLITRGVDVGKRLIHWVTRAWAEDGTGYVIDYGYERTYQQYGSEEGVEEAINSTLMNLFEKAELSPSDATPYCYEDGTPVAIKATFVDSRYYTGPVRQAVKQACEAWTTRFYTCMGCGKSSNCFRTSYAEQSKSTLDKRAGDHFHLSRITETVGHGVWECRFDKDYYIRYEQSRWMAPDPGGLWLYGVREEGPAAVHMSQAERDHKDFAKMIVNEKEVEVVKKGVKVREWQKQGANHYLDAAVYSVVAAVKEGIKLPGLAAKPMPQTVTLSGTKERPTRESLARYW